MRNGTPGFHGARLVDARDSLGLTQVALASLIGRTSASISRWEAGDQSPEPEALGRLAQALGVPTGFFLRSQPDHGNAPMFFRSMASTTQAARRRAKVRLRWAQDISLSLQEWVDLPDVDVPRVLNEDYRDIRDEDIEAVASRCREAWGLGVGPIADLLLVMENAGVCVVREEVGTAAMDGLSNWSAADQRPYVLIAADKATCFRSRFDAAHELGHLVLHGSLRTVPLSDKAAFKEIERQAFLFAGAFLLPGESFAAEVLSPSLTGLLALKERWKVSVGAMIKRCDDLGMMSEDFARRTWTHYSARGWRKAEPLDDTTSPEMPRLLARSVRLLLDEGVRPRADLLDDLRLHASDVESLCGLPRGFFSGAEGEVVKLPQLKPRAAEADAADVGAKDGVVVPFPRH